MAALTPDGSVYTLDTDIEAWRHIPDVATANAMGLDWNNLDRVEEVPQPTGPDWPSLAPAPAAPAAPAGGGGGGFDGGDLSEAGVYNAVMLAYGAEEQEGAVVLPAQAWDELRNALVQDVPYVGNHVRSRGRGMVAPLASRLWSRGT